MRHHDRRSRLQDVVSYGVATLTLAASIALLSNGPWPVDPASASAAGGSGPDGRAQAARIETGGASGAPALPHEAVLSLLRRAEEAAGGRDARRRAKPAGSPTGAAAPRWLPPASDSLSAQTPSDYRDGLRIEAGDLSAQQTLLGAATSPSLASGNDPAAAVAASRVATAVERTFGQAPAGAVRAAYAEVRPGVDALVESAPGRAEEFLVVRRPEALAGLAWRIDLPSAIRTVRAVAGFWEFRDAAGTPRLRLHPLAARDARGRAVPVRARMEGIREIARAADGSAIHSVEGALTLRLEVAAGGGAAYPIVIDPAWSATTSMLNVRHEHTATLLPDGRVLVAGGNQIPVPNAPTAACEIYDPATGTWSVTGPMATARNAHTATLLPTGKVLVAGGTNTAGVSVASCELYDPSTGAWSATGPLPAARYQHCATLLSGGQVLVTGGGSAPAPSLTSCALYDPGTGLWSATGSLATGRESHCAALLPNGKVLVAGGWPYGAGNIGIATCEVYDPALGTWSGTAPLASARYNFTATVFANGKVLAAGGESGGSAMATCELYDPGTGLWSGTGALANARADHSAELLPSGRLLAIGGSITSCELYNPVAGTWSATATLAVARRYHTSTLLASGEVLVAGSYIASTSLSSCELYDPQAGGWSVTAVRPGGGGQHTATLLPNGKVLVAGGWPAVATCELYDPAAGTWALTGSMGTSRRLHSATLLASGKVLVAGGDTGAGALTTSCELYDPGTGTWSPTGPMGAVRQAFPATLLPNGKVLVAGGLLVPAGNYTAACELYDPTSGTWSPTAPMSVAASERTATLLPNGKVILVGGRAAAPDPLPTCQLYDPASGTWSPTGAMATPRYAHHTVLLPNGQLLVAGGQNVVGASNIATCELYDPAAGTWTGTGAMAGPRIESTLTLLPNGKAVIAGGGGVYGGPALASSEVYDPATGSWSATGALSAASTEATGTLLPNGQVLYVAPSGDCELYNDLGPLPAGSQPTIATVNGSAVFPAGLAAGAPVTVGGSGFRGISEAGGGNCGGNSSTNFPIVVLGRVDARDGSPAGGGVHQRLFFRAATGWAGGTTLTFTAPTSAEVSNGQYFVLWVIVNGIHGPGKIVKFGGSVPDTTLTAFPPNPSASGGATFDFASTVPGSTFERSLDGGAYVPVAPPEVLAGLAPGAHTYSVRAIDPGGTPDPTPAAYAWTIDTAPPTITSAAASLTSGTAPLTTQFTAGATDPSGVILYQWDFNGDGVYDYSSAAGGTVDYTYGGPGSYTAKLRVVDAAGNSSTATVGVTVAAPPPQASYLTASTAGGTVPLAVGFLVKFPPVNAAAYEWDFDGDGVYDLVTAVPSAAHTYTAAGAFAPGVRMVLADGSVQSLGVAPIATTLPPAVGGVTARIVRLFRDLNKNGAYDAGLPTELLAFNAAGLGPQASVTGVALGFTAEVDNATAIPPGYEIARWEWDFDGAGEIDGRSPVGVPALLQTEATHTFSAPGTFNVTVRCTWRLAGGGPDQFSVSAVLPVTVAVPSTANRRVWIVQPVGPRHGAGGAPAVPRIAGTGLLFNVNLAPASQFNFNTIELQVWDPVGAGGWVPVPAAYVAAAGSAGQSGRLRVNIEQMIGDGFNGIFAGATRAFRAVATATGGAVVASATDSGPGSDEGDLQGPMIYALVTAGGIPAAPDVSGMYPPETEDDAVGPDNEHEATETTGSQIAIGYDGVGGVTVVQIDSLAANPAPTTSGKVLTEFHDIKLTVGALKKPARVRLTYHDDNGDGLEDTKGIAVANLKVYHYDGTKWVPLQDQTHSVSEHWVEGTTTGLSPFALGAEGAVGSGGSGGGGSGGSGKRHGRCFIGALADGGGSPVGSRAWSSAGLLLLAAGLVLVRRGRPHLRERKP